MQPLQRKWLIGLFLLGVAISWLMHQPYSGLPPYSQHTWRQTLTLSVADNFYQEEMNLFKPRINNRGTTEGVTGMHFPLYEYCVAQAYRVFGPEFWVHRVFSFLLTAWGAWFLLLLTRQWFKNNWTALVAGIFYLFSPEIFFNGFTALPDVLALPMIFMALWSFNHWWDDGNWKFLILAILGFLIGGLIKLQYLGAGFLILGYVIRDFKQIQVRQWLLLTVFGILSVIPVLAWYKYSTWLILQSGMADVGLELKPAESLSFALYVLRKNIIIDVPEVLLGYVATFGILSAAYIYFSKRIGRSHSLFLPILFFGIGYSLYHILELKVLEHHQYYMMPYLPVLLPVAARGVTSVVKKKIVLLGLLVLHIALAGFRMIPSRFNGTTFVQEAFWQPKMRNSLRQLLKPMGTESLIVTGPDESMCINFYYLNSQGWNFRDINQLLDTTQDQKPNIQLWAEQGARYFVTDSREIDGAPEVKKWLNPNYRQVGEFRVYEFNLSGK